ncbi:MAG: hypothetical protein EA397_09305 [Deltaproteobacteria bacterium]|nr:MAG: hypothetical protein EA397_09305 [Deltaproteobacteria bacterium]
MQRFCLLLSLSLAAPLLGNTAALAVDIEDLDSDSGKKDKKKKKTKEERSPVLSDDEIIREIERGWYFKANGGVADWVGRFGGGLLQMGSLVAFSVGNDFVDEPNRSMSYQFTFQQGVHNGMPYDVQALNGVPPNRNIQGDTRTFSLLASYRFAAYPTRRLGLGFQVGAGVMFTPLLVEKGSWDNTVVPAWGGNNPDVHRTPHFPLFAGPTVEYYTKLSHFSIGIDTDFTYAIGFDFGFNATGFMKYTF